MSPLLIDGHEKKLIWCDLDDDYQELDNLVDDVGDEHLAILEDTPEIARLYLRHVKTGKISANFVFEFELVAPAGFPERIPQVTSAFVDEDFRNVKLSQHVYQAIMSHYGVVVSDTHQTAGGMFIWLLMSERNNVQLNIMQVRGDHLEYRMVGGEPEVYTGDIDALSLVGNTIWGGPEEVVSALNLERLGFRPAHRDMSHIVLAARASLHAA